MGARQSNGMTTAQVMKVIAGIALIFAVLSYFTRSRRIIETLHSPVAVRGWTQAGLKLADGRTVQLPGFKSLPATSQALAESTKRGVELAADGRVYGLVRVHHWCGNDRIKEHIARVDLALYLEYLCEGQLTVGPPSGLDMEFEREGRISEYGWNVSEFYNFRLWCEMLDDLRRTAMSASQAQPTPAAATSLPKPAAVVLDEGSTRDRDR